MNLNNYQKIKTKLKDKKQKTKKKGISDEKHFLYLKLIHFFLISQTEKKHRRLARKKKTGCPNKGNGTENLQVKVSSVLKQEK